MLNEPLVSVICPIYNTSPIFLCECIESVLGQSYDNFEFIMVDDCSSDESTIDIINAYESDVNREKIRIIHNVKNKGQASCRNIGIDSAQGEYISFIDSDDIYEHDFLDVMVSEILKDRGDYVCCYYRLFQELIHKKNDEVNKKEKSDYAVFHNESMCVHLYSAEFLKINDIRFPDGKISEDPAFAQMCNVMVSKCRQIDYVGYNYRINNGSTCRNMSYYKLGRERLPLDYFSKCADRFVIAKGKGILINADAVQLELYISLPVHIWVYSCKCELRERLALSKWCEKLISNKYYDIDKNVLFFDHEQGGEFCSDSVWKLAHIMQFAVKHHCMSLTTVIVTSILSIYFSIRNLNSKP